MYVDNKSILKIKSKKKKKEKRKKKRKKLKSDKEEKEACPQSQFSNNESILIDVFTFFISHYEIN